MPLTSSMVWSSFFLVGVTRSAVERLVEMAVFVAAEAEVAQMVFAEAVEAAGVLGDAMARGDGAGEAGGGRSDQIEGGEAWGAVEHLWSPRFDMRSMPPDPA